MKTDTVSVNPFVRVFTAENAENAEGDLITNQKAALA